MLFHNAVFRESYCIGKVFARRGLPEHYGTHGYKQEVKEQTQVETTYTAYNIDANGKPTVAGTPGTDVEKVLDTKLTYVGKDQVETKDKAEHIQTLDRGVTISMRSEKSVVKHTYSYGNKDESANSSLSKNQKEMINSALKIIGALEKLYLNTKK